MNIIHFQSTIKPSNLHILNNYEIQINLDFLNIDLSSYDVCYLNI